MSDLPLEQPYSPEALDAALKSAGAWRAARRVLAILRVMAAGLLWRTVDRWRWTYRRGETVEQRQRRRATWLLGRIVALGPTFVKVGQSLATRPDLLPLTYIQVLSALHDRLPPFDDAIAFGLIEQELGWRPLTLFEQFEPRPFAAASLGQVYHAVTHAGEEVAVKVQRPDLAMLISLDLALARRLAAALVRLPRLARGRPWVSLIDELGAKLFEELDYVHEAHLTERFRANLRGMPGIYAPRVDWEHTSRRVLTTEYVAGIKVTDREALDAAGVDVRALLAQGVRANLRQLFEDGLFHADPHPGNLLVRPEDGALVFLDFGMMGIIEPAQKERILELFVDVMNRRPENLRENLIALGCLQPDARWDEIVPLANSLFRSLFGDSEARHSFQDVANAFSPLVYEYEFRIPIDFATIVRAILILEGVCRQLDPGFDIFAVSAPYAARMMLTVPSPTLRQRLLAELVTAEGGLNWARFRQLAALAARDHGFRLETDGLVGPALDLLLSAEGAPLRSALVGELLREPGDSPGQIESLGSLLSADSTITGRQILQRLVAYLLSEEGAATRAQLAAGLRSGDNGRSRLDVARTLEVVRLAGRLHPGFRLGTLLQILGGHLLSEEGRPARGAILTQAKQWVVAGLADGLGRLARPVVTPVAAAATEQAG